MADNSGKRETGSKGAVKTTTVGGQPPGGEGGVEDGVPMGIEALLSMAAVDDQFSNALLQDRDEAILASGVQLTKHEQAILGLVDNAALEHMIASVHGLIPESERREFLGRSAAAMLFLMSGGAALGASGCKEINPMTATGSRPDPPGPPPTPIETGSRPDLPDEVAPKPDVGVPQPTPAPPTGHRPDPPPNTMPLSRGISPDRPEPTRSPRTGSRPDRPKPKPDAGKPKRPPRSRGISPDRPRPMPLSRGISPDRPKPKE